MNREWKLTTLDLFSLSMVIRGTWIYREMPDVESMREALKQLIRTYPHLTGHYNEKRKALVWENDYNDEPSLEITTNVAYSVNDLAGNSSLTRSLVREYDIQAFRKGKKMPFSATLVKVKDGAVLIVQCAHATMDGYSYYHLMEQWAALTRGESIQPMMVDQSQIPQKDALTKTETLTQVKQSEWLKLKPAHLIKMLWNLFRMKFVKDTYIQKVSQEEITRLKQQSGAGTHAVLSAIVAKELKSRSTRMDDFKLISVANLRGHVLGISKNLMGNLSQPFITRESLSPNLDLISLARAIQQQNDAVLKNDTIDHNLRLTICSSHYGLPYIWFDPSEMFSPHPSNLYINNQLQFRACELDFGAGLPLYVFPSELPDTVKFWQPVSGGPVQIIYSGYPARMMAESKNPAPA